MTNPVDFRARQVQVNKIIANDPDGPTNKILIYGNTANTDNHGGVNSGVFPQSASIALDTFLYVSGAVNSKTDSKAGIAVFGGDVVVSGSLYQGRVDVKGGAFSHAEGYGTFAEGTFSHAEGTSTIAHGAASHAEGESTVAHNAGAHSEGKGTLAYGSYSHTEGEKTNVFYNNSTHRGYAAHAEGKETSACGDAAHAEGYHTSASGSYSHAEGIYTIAFGTGSNASGYGTIASGAVDGTALSSTSIIQTATGRFNVRNNTTSLFVVGNGTGDLDISRKDLFSVDSINQEGMVKIKGGLAYQIKGYNYYSSPSSIQYTLTLEDYLVIVNVTDGGPFSVYLPASATTPLGTTYVIRRIDAGSLNTVNVHPNGSDAIIRFSGPVLPPLFITGAGDTGGCVTLTYIGNYYDSTFGTNPTWMTTSELDL